jgi:acyl-CoA dehydrogenase
MSTVNETIRDVISEVVEDAPTAVTPEASSKPDLVAIARDIGERVAGPNADAVDREGRFPAESLAALKESKLLAALVPVEFGGLGASLHETAEAVRTLAAYCASSALVLGMHSIEALGLVGFGHTPELQDLLRRVGTGQVLLANANSEVGVGAEISRSLCALESREDGLFLDKQALAISFGEYADAIVAKTRRSPDAAETDQVLVFCLREDLHLEVTSPWDTMGLRGTCSSSFRLTSRVREGLVFPMPFLDIINDGSYGGQQLFLSAVWVGLAEAALSRAHAYARAAARKSIGTVPPSAQSVASMAAEVDTARGLFEACAMRMEEMRRTGAPQDPSHVMMLRNLKIRTSQVAVATATAAINVCGIAGFRRNTPFSLDRIVRDAHGGLIMVSNERLLRDNAQLLVARKAI